MHLKKFRGFDNFMLQQSANLVRILPSTSFENVNKPKRLKIQKRLRGQRLLVRVQRQASLWLAVACASDVFLIGWLVLQRLACVGLQSGLLRPWE